MTAAAVILFFLICPPDDCALCEAGEVQARSCEAAEAYIRAALRAEQTLHVTQCIESEG